MEIAVCVKRVPLVGSTFILTDDAMAIDTSRIGATLSPHEENAVEAAVRLIEMHGGASRCSRWGQPKPRSNYVNSSPLVQTVPC